MQTILIPPVPHLKDFMQPMNMLLAHMVLKDTKYAMHYKLCRVRNDQYNILDNGAHELGRSMEPTNLVTAAIDVKANEMVASDCLFDGAETVRLTRNFLEYFVGEGRRRFHRAGMDLPRLMLVPQGKTLAEWFSCYSDLVAMHAEFNVGGILKQPVIAVTRHAEQVGLLAILDSIARMRAHESYRHDVHLLGLTRNIALLPAIARKHGAWIRSVDSAKPISFAAQNISLPPAKEIARKDFFEPEDYKGRTFDYFNTELTRTQYVRSVLNACVFKELANAPAA